MTLDEAYELLEIEPGTASDQVRRAYLRKVKKHKPDRDPEGFRNVREAFEMLRRHAAFAELLSAAEEEVDEVEAESSHDEEPSGEGALGEEEFIIDAQDLDEEDLIEPELAFNELDEIPEDAPPEIRLEAVDEVIAKYPDVAQLYWTRIHILQELERDDEVTAALREADALGFRGFFDTLALWVPQELTEEELERARGVDNLSVLVRLARMQAAQGSPLQAAEIAHRLTELAVEQDAAWVGHSLLEVFFELQAVHALEASHDVLGDLERLLKEIGELPVLGNEATLYGWWLAQELRLTPATFDADVRALVARQILVGEADEDLIRDAWRLPEALPESESTLREQGMTNVAEVLRHLQTQPPPHDAPWTSRVRWHTHQRLKSWAANENLLILLGILLGVTLKACFTDW